MVLGQLPPMSGVERVNLIQQRLREVQQRWTDLKAEVAYIERKRRRAKRKEREGELVEIHTLEHTFPLRPVCPLLRWGEVGELDNCPLPVFDV